jgi:hypothetical protein
VLAFPERSNRGMTDGGAIGQLGANLSFPFMALFGPDRPDWRRLFVRVKRTFQLRTQTSEFDP